MVLQQRELRVTSMTWESEGVLSVTLGRIESNDPLPAWEPGAHIDIYVPDGTTRQYSLCGDPADRTKWQIAVLREPESRGGSSFIHDVLRVGQHIMVTRPKNHFALEPASHHTLIAGGIGITPMMAMAEHLAAEGKPFRLVYGGRSLETMAFLPRLAALGDAVQLVPQDTDGLPDLAEILEAAPDGGLVYVCGPLPLLRAVEDAATKVHGEEHDVLRFELFSRAGLEPESDAPAMDADSYELVLTESGHTLRLKPDANILDVVLALGIEVENDCRDGICGSCVVPIVEGTVEHRDLVLTKKEQAAMDQMLICCSQPTSGCLKLKL